MCAIPTRVHVCCMRVVFMSIGYTLLNCVSHILTIQITGVFLCKFDAFTCSVSVLCLMLSLKCSDHRGAIAGGVVL